MVKTIRLTPDAVQHFVEVTSKCDFDIDISYNRYVVDAKSFLGVYGLDFRSPLTVTYEGYNEEGDDMWHWTRDAIINGEKVTLKERNDANVLQYIGHAKYGNAPVTTDDANNWGWYKVSYDADGYVIDAEKITWSVSPAPTTEQDAVYSVVNFNTGSGTEFLVCSAVILVLK